MFRVAATAGAVPCCLCGAAVAPNPAGMCVACLRGQVDITDGLPKACTVLFCRQCGRYLQPPRAWLRAGLESKELLAYCLKRVKNLHKVKVFPPAAATNDDESHLPVLLHHRRFLQVKLVDAGFVWTEPHSKRLKVKLTIQKEVFNGAILQQSFVVEYVVEDHMCDSCARAAANPDQWVAVVQVRQKVDHKKTFLFLEQLILRHGADAHTINIRQHHDGLDFFYANRSHALKFIDFLNSVVPVQYRHDKQLVSHDSKNNSYNYKFTFSVEICPICKDDLICLPPKVSSALGAIGPLVICIRVSNTILLLDPNTLRTAYLDATQYWRAPFRVKLTYMSWSCWQAASIWHKQLTEYVCLDIEPVSQADHGRGTAKMALADATVARSTDFGRNDTQFLVRTHLGNLLSPGDHVAGYDLYGANLNDAELEKHKALVLPDVVLVKKSYEEKRRRRRGRARPWKLKSLAMEVEPAAPATGGRGADAQSRAAMDYERFLEDLEEDPELRSKIALYKDPRFVARAADEASVATDGDGEEPPEVPLEELLLDLRIGDNDEHEDGGSDGSNGSSEHDDMEL
eukprot:SM000138S00052  [mRNA]  locus=s138:279441:282508:- [translate_table: standard]